MPVSGPVGDTGFETWTGSSWTLFEGGSLLLIRKLPERDMVARALARENGFGDRHDEFSTLTAFAMNSLDDASMQVILREEVIMVFIVF